MLHIPIVHAHDVSKQIPREKNILRDFLLWDFNWLRIRWQFTPNMENCEPADEEELPTFSLGMEFLTPQKGRKEKENKEQTRSSSRFATLSESELENILAERHSERTNQITNWSVGAFKGKYFYLKCF